MYSYQQVYPDIDTGDLVLFSGKGGESTLVRLLSNSRWSHIGMAVRLGDGDDVRLWEAAPSEDLTELEHIHAPEGVRLVPLRERLGYYEGDFAIRHLQVHRHSAMLSALHAFREEVDGLPYEKDWLELFRAPYDGPFGANRKEALSSVFCSELVAAAYQRMGLLPSEPPSNEYIPADFASEAGLNLLQGALGPERAITSVELTVDLSQAGVEP